MKKLFLWTLGLFGVITVLGIIGGQRASEETAQPQEFVGTDTNEALEPAETSEPIEPYNDPGISMAEFQQIGSGMSYEEVTKIIGGPGELVSDSDIAGYRTVMFAYKGETGLGANANVMFQNNKMIQKAQFGLQ